MTLLHPTFGHGHRGHSDDRPSRRLPLDWIRIYDEPDPAPAIEGCIYSTRPTVSSATNGKRYFLKGPDQTVVAAEVIAYALAERVNISVPRCALCKHPRTDEILFATEAAIINSGIDRLLAPRYAVNPDLLADVIAFDVWIANGDRNPGSLVAQPLSGHKEPRVRLLAIDFEKSEVLRGRSIIEVTALDPARWWPTGDLAAMCVGLELPIAQILRIRELKRTHIDQILAATMTALGRTLDRADAIAHQLASRATNIEGLTREVWNV